MYYPKLLGEDINCITIIITLEIVEDTKTEKNHNDTVSRIFLSPIL